MVAQEPLLRLQIPSISISRSREGRGVINIAHERRAIHFTGSSCLLAYYIRLTVGGLLSALSISICSVPFALRWLKLSMARRCIQSYDFVIHSSQRRGSAL